MKNATVLLRRRGLLVAVVASASLGFASAASAATYTVNDQRDLPQSPTAASGSCISTGSTCTLRAAVEAANQNGGSSTINVPAGTYPLSSAGETNPNDCNNNMTKDSLKVDECNNSTSITVIGAGSGSTVINAGGDSTRIFDLFPNGTLDVQKMTLENGDGTSSADSKGGPLFVDNGGAIDSDGHLSAENVTFTGNSTEYGGAILADDNPGSTISATGDVFQNNSASVEGGAVYSAAPNDVTFSFDLFQANNSVDGGAFYGASGEAAGLTLNFDDLVQNVTSNGPGGAIAWFGDGALNVTNSLLNQNQASGDTGGAIYNDADVNVNVSTTSFDGNTAEWGGAMYDDTGGSNQMALTQDRFSGNSSTTNGGALYLDSNDSTGTTILSSEFDGNSSPTSGGAITWGNDDDPGTLALEGDSFVLNTSGSGAALDDENSSAADALVMVDSTMSRNTASTDGGGIYEAYNETYATFTNDTIAFNNAPAGEGGGVAYPSGFFSDGTHTFGIENTIVAENSGGDCGPSGNKFGTAPSSSSFDVGNNDDSDQSCFGAVGGPNDKVGVNPLLSNPANNGGPPAGGPGDTETLQTDAESASSPTVDAGNNSGCPSVDERGVSRPQGTACDIGAFEFGAGPSSTTTTTATTSTGVTTSSGITTVTHSTTKSGGKRCSKGKHKSHGRCVKNKKPKKKKCPRGKVRRGKRCIKKHAK